VSDAGTRLVGEAGATMTDIVGSVRRVSDVINEISLAAGEQTQGIGQVNNAVAQLDSMTQQNSALVEQSAAAAESMREQASRLSQAVGTFRLTLPPADRRVGPGRVGIVRALGGRERDRFLHGLPLLVKAARWALSKA
jgi:uncharacterized phage infection (PIP) family protein YhgE